MRETSDRTVDVCADCGSDTCANRSAACPTSNKKPLSLPNIRKVPACQYVGGISGLSWEKCLRPEKKHTSGWTHAFVPPVERLHEPFGAEAQCCASFPDCWHKSGASEVSPTNERCEGHPLCLECGGYGNPAHDDYCCDECRGTAGRVHSEECSLGFDDGCVQPSTEPITTVIYD